MKIVQRRHQVEKGQYDKFVLVGNGFARVRQSLVGHHNFVAEHFGLGLDNTLSPTNNGGIVEAQRDAR
jgi:hypothetical protein